MRYLEGGQDVNYVKLSASPTLCLRSNKHKIDGLLKKADSRFPSAAPAIVLCVSWPAIPSVCRLSDLLHPL